MYAKILEIPGFSEKTATVVLRNFGLSKIFIQKMGKYVGRDIEVEEEVAVIEESKVSGMVVVFSGFRDPELEKMILERGGKVTTSVSKNTNIVVSADPSKVTGKVQKALDLGKKVLTIEEFRHLL